MGRPSESRSSGTWPRRPGALIGGMVGGAAVAEVPAAEPDAGGGVAVSRVGAAESAAGFDASWALPTDFVADADCCGVVVFAGAGGDVACVAVAGADDDVAAESGDRWPAPLSAGAPALVTD